MLASALAQLFQTFGGEELYPSAVEKACRYAVGIISGHPSWMETSELVLLC